MSTLESLLIPDTSLLPETLREPLSGISFAVYMFVEASRLDDIELPAMLGWLGIRESDFARAEELWSERVGDELERDEGTFDELYAELLGSALLFWNRSIEPLDGDVATWIHLQRHLLVAADPFEMGRSMGLTQGDEIRLERQWRTRFAEPEVAAIALAAWSSSLLPRPKLVIAPLVFPAHAEAT